MKWAVMLCLDAGADDLIPKPFVFTELAARIRLRRGSQAMRAQSQVEYLVMDRLSHASPRSQDRSETKGIFAVEFLMRPQRTSAPPGDHRRAGLAAGRGDDDERWRRICELFAAKSGWVRVTAVA